MIRSVPEVSAVGCISCRFGWHDRLQTGALFCRRYPRLPIKADPPAATEQNPAPQGQVYAHFPAMEPTDWCGEYSKKDRKASN